MRPSWDWRPPGAISNACSARRRAILPCRRRRRRPGLGHCPPGGCWWERQPWRSYEPTACPWSPGSWPETKPRAAAAGGELGYPEVLKIISPEWVHKSDWGGVCLNVTTEAELRQAYRDLVARFGRRTPAGTLSGILVQKQVKGIELLFGVKRDPQFGPVLVAGAGGIYTEVLKDVARGLAPLTSAQADKMLQSLKIYPILQGVRGQTGVNLTALTEALVNLSRLAVDYPEIRELDLNPVVADAQTCWCVDCRMVLGE